ncbi:hypothetical protein [Komagataeibacter saccharivorans]|uniref:hypothetical protein n=1 Tax=Komagataeibacter saccharivorans TaxID=265959 RepID=UPI0039EA5C66
MDPAISELKERVAQLEIDLSARGHTLGLLAKLAESTQGTLKDLTKSHMEQGDRVQQLTFTMLLSIISAAQIISTQNIWKKHKIRTQLKKFPIEELAPTQKNAVSAQYYEMFLSMHALLIKATQWRAIDLLAEAKPLLFAALGHAPSAF